MTSKNSFRKTFGFTLIEILVAMSVFGVFAAALLKTWTVLQTTALNTTAYAQRQNDQVRIIDYLKRDIRRATKIEIYNGATLVTGTAFGNEIRVTLPDYYADSREEDNAIGTKVTYTPVLTAGTVTYGAPMTVRYYVSNGAVVRNEAGILRRIADSAGVFTTSFSKETSGRIRCRVTFGQRMRSSNNRTLSRQIEVVCGQRAQLQL